MTEASTAEQHEAQSRAARVRADADLCVMCGLCLPHCPTFAVSGLETESPRGRIAIARQLALGGEGEGFAQALESCLQCRSCESVCPAQVPYGRLIEDARALLPGREAPNPTMAFARWPRASAWLAGLAGAMARLLGGTGAGRWHRRLLRAQFPVRGLAGADARTWLFGGCAARSFEASAQRQMLAVAARIGEPMQMADGFACCGAIERHLGRSEAASERARKLRDALGRIVPTAIVALDSACIDGLRKSLQGRVAIIEGSRWLLDRVGCWSSRLAVRSERVGLFLPCSHRNAVGDVAAVRGLLARLPGLDLVEVGTGLGCCGSAGPHLLADPTRAEVLAAPIVERISGLKLDRLVTTNVGCALHLSERLLASGIELPVTHPVACLADRLLEESSDVAPFS
jgi:glycolate oxidase iron-sulfur subunit